MDEKREKQSYGRDSVQQTVKTGMKRRRDEVLSLGSGLTKNHGLPVYELLKVRGLNPRSHNNLEEAPRHKCWNSAVT